MLALVIHPFQLGGPSCLTGPRKGDCFGFCRSSDSRNMFWKFLKFSGNGLHIWFWKIFFFLWILETYSVEDKIKKLRSLLTAQKGKRTQKSADFHIGHLIPLTKILKTKDSIRLVHQTGRTKFCVTHPRDQNVIGIRKLKIPNHGPSTVVQQLKFSS